LLNPYNHKEKMERKAFKIRVPVLTVMDISAPRTHSLPVFLPENLQPNFGFGSLRPRRTVFHVYAATFNASAPCVKGLAACNRKEQPDNENQCAYFIHCSPPLESRQLRLVKQFDFAYRNPHKASCIAF
jgi:hypothetical protein